MGEGETVGALGDFDFQAVVWGGGDALDALSGADFEHFAAFPYGFAVGREEDGGVVDSADDGFGEDVPGESWCVAFRREQKTK